MRALALAALVVLGCGTVTADPKDGAAATGGAQAAAGGRGGATAGEGGAQGGAAGGAGGQGAGVLSAPTCQGTFVGTSQPAGCPQIPSPTDPTNPKGGWQCEVGCSSDAAENATGCLFYGVTYCVADCSACHL